MTEVTRYGNPLIECAGAHIRALSRQLATVVTVSGAIDSANLDKVTAFVRQFVLAEKSFVLDLGGVEQLTEQATTLLTAVAAACERRGVQWALIPGAVVSDFLAKAGLSDEVSVAGSVPDALEHFTEATSARRTMLLSLLNKTA